MNFETDVLRVIAKERIAEAEQWAAIRGAVRSQWTLPFRMRLGLAIVWIGHQVIGEPLCAVPPK